VRNVRGEMRKGQPIFALSKIVPTHYPLEESISGESEI
jgi:hypothetical protein